MTYDPRQPGLFDHIKPEPMNLTPTVRRRLNALLQAARAAELLPFDDEDPAYYELIFPQMAGQWIPEPERRELCDAFAAELARLRAATPSTRHRPPSPPR